jgi:hypothetical protein
MRRKKGETKMKNIYCHYEPGLYPESEFVPCENGQFIHRKGALHYTTGERVVPDDNSGLELPTIPGLPAHIQALLVQSRRDASLMSHDDIEALLSHIQIKS